MGRQGLYADPVVYDILYTPGTADEVTALEKLERRFAAGEPKTDRLWLEPACGTGRYLRVARRRGRTVAGFDLDPVQLDYARGRPQGSPGNLFMADMADFRRQALAAGIRPGSVDFAFNPVNSLRHLDSDRSLLAHLDQMAVFLGPGAIYVVGLSLTDYSQLVPEEDLWQAARGRCRVSQLVNYLPPEPETARGRAEQVISHLTVERPRGTEHFDDTYDLRTYDLGQWRDLVEKSRLDHAGSFDAVARPLGERASAYQLEVLRNS